MIIVGYITAFLVILLGLANDIMILASVDVLSPAQEKQV